MYACNACPLPLAWCGQVSVSNAFGASSVVPFTVTKSSQELPSVSLNVPAAITKQENDALYISGYAAKGKCLASRAEAVAVTLLWTVNGTQPAPGSCSGTQSSVHVCMVSACHDACMCTCVHGCMYALVHVCWVVWVVWGGVLFLGVFV